MHAFTYHVRSLKILHCYNVKCVTVRQPHINLSNRSDWRVDNRHVGAIAPHLLSRRAGTHLEISLPVCAREKEPKQWAKHVHVPHLSSRLTIVSKTQHVPAAQEAASLISVTQEQHRLSLMTEAFIHHLILYLPAVRSDGILTTSRTENPPQSTPSQLAHGAGNAGACLYRSALPAVGEQTTVTFMCIRKMCVRLKL